MQPGVPNGSQPEDIVGNNPGVRPPEHAAEENNIAYNTLPFAGAGADLPQHDPIRYPSVPEDTDNSDRRGSVRASSDPHTSPIAPVRLVPGSSSPNDVPPRDPPERQTRLPSAIFEFTRPIGLLTPRQAEKRRAEPENPVPSSSRGQKTSVGLSLSFVCRFNCSLLSRRI